MKDHVFFIFCLLLIISMPVLADHSAKPTNKQVVKEVNQLPGTGSGKLDDCE